MSINRASAAIPPIIFRSVARSARNSRITSWPRRQHPAIALLVPRRAVSTDTSTSSGGAGNFPPPGFNTAQAKKPLTQTQQEQQQAKEADQAEISPQQDDGQKSPDTLVGKQSASATSRKIVSEGKTAQEHVAQKGAEDATADEKKVEKKKEEDKKLTVWQKVKKEAAHYWDGTKLLATEVKISWKLAMKMAAGYELTRRENRQLQRTVQDLGRLVPFSVFVIVPFAELLLPIALRLFPNLLPSTYEGQKAKEKKAGNLRQTRKEVSSFLRQTLKESGLPVSAANAQREEFMEFFRKVRTTGESPSASDVIKVCKIFKDDLTLDNLSRPQLVGICRYMNLNTFGTDTILRYQIRHRMRQIKRDDRAISYEGVGSLSVPELQTACASRGLRTHGMSPARLREDLQMWLDLRLKHGVPSTLLVLSNAFVYAQGKETELNSQIDALQAVLASVPEELFHEIELEVHNAEGAATNKQRLEVLKEQQELIDAENQQGTTEHPKDVENIDEKDEHDVDESAKDASSEVAVEEHTVKAESTGKTDESKKEV